MGSLSSSWWPWPWLSDCFGEALPNLNLQSLPRRSKLRLVKRHPGRSYVVYTQAAKDDFEAAKGMPGYQETLQTPILEPSPERLKRGAELFQFNCALCHGSVGKGDGDGGASLSPLPTDLTRRENYKYGHMELGIFRSAKYDIPRTGCAPWEGIISDDDLWSITDYVRFLQED